MRLWDQPESLFARSAIAVAAIVCVAPAFAQNTTSAITGRVVDGNGRPVSGATVAIRHVDSGSTTNATTDGEGRYSARGLRAGGPYTVTISKGGQTDRRDGIVLALAETQAVDGLLGGTTQQIVVTGAAVNQRFNAANMGAGTNLNSTAVTSLPTIQRNLQDLARTDPRIAQTDKERGEISALGQNSRFNSITIDGVSTNDPFGLEANNLPMVKQPVSMDAIQAVQINVSNFDVTQKGYTGANINAVTKSGTNEFKGSVYYVFRNQDLAGSRFNRQTGGTVFPNAPFKETTMGAVLGGPIIKDKLFFLVNYEELKSSRAAPSFGPVGSSLTNVGITPAQIAGVQAAARAYGFDAGSLDIPPGVNLEVKEFLAKLDWNISDTQRANVRYTKTEETNPIFPSFSGTVLSLNSYWYDQVKTNEALVAQWFSDWTDNFSTELKVSQRNYVSAPDTKSNLPQIGLVFTGPPPAGTSGTTRTLLLGTEQFRHFNRLETETLDTYLGATWILGNHELKFGADYIDNSIYNAFVNNSKGVYEFRGADPVALFAAGTPSTYTLRFPINGYSLADGAANWTLQNLGLFVQDTWRVSKNFNLMAGVRLDRTIVGDKPIRNPGFRAAFGFDNDTTMDGKQVVQPRLGFNLNLTPAGGRRMQLRGGIGLFEGSSSNVWLTNPYQNTGVQNATLSCGGSGAACPPGLAFTPNVNAQPAIPGTTPAAAVDLISPSLRQPSLWKTSLAFEAELPWAGIVASAEWIHTKVQSGINYRHLNLGAATTRGTDGRPLFWNAAAQGTACWNGGDALVANCGGLSRAGRNTAFADVLIAENSKKGGGDALTLALAGSVARTFNWNLAYTRTKATEASPLSSSTAISNWNGRAVFDPNEEIAARSAYEVKDRIGGGFTWNQQLFGNYKTTIGLFYEGRRGKPYSWTFRNDANGDGIAGNDLMYIPSRPGSGEVVFFGATQAARDANEARFWSFIEASPELSANRGRVLSRNSDSAPWVNSWDIRFAQEFAGFAKGHKAVLAFDILNFGNMLNRKWGRIDEVGFNGGNVGGVLNRGGNARSFVNFAGLDGGKYVYNTQNTVEDFTTKQDRLESQWQIQVTLRYEF
jgi:hypothetical protein